MRTALMKGDALFTYIGNRDYYTNELAIIVENGMKTGKVAEDLQYYSQWLFQEIEETIQKKNGDYAAVFTNRRWRIYFNVVFSCDASDV